MSSTQTPGELRPCRRWRRLSEISILLTGVGGRGRLSIARSHRSDRSRRATRRSSPSGAQPSSVGRLVVRRGTDAARASTGTTLPVDRLVWPLASGSVVQSSEPTGCTSTKKKSHVGSVSRVTQNDSSPPPAGTRDRAGEPLVRQVARLRERELVAGARRYWLVQPGVDRVPIVDAAARGRRGRRTHRSAIIARYEAIGSRAFQTHVVRPPPRHASLELAVGDRLEPARDGDLERVRRLVARMVVRRVPRGRAVGLADLERAIVRVEEARRDPGSVCGTPSYAMRTVNLLRVAQPARRPDRQLAVGVGPASPASPFTRTDADRQVVEIEVEARQVLGRPRFDRCHAGQRVRWPGRRRGPTRSA